MKYGLDAGIFRENAGTVKPEFDVTIWWVDHDEHEHEGWTYICVPQQSVLEMISLHFEMSYVEALVISQANILSIDEDFESVKARLAKVQIAEPTDYLAVVKYIKETPQQKFDSEEVTVAAQ